MIQIAGTLRRGSSVLISEKEQVTLERPSLQARAMAEIALRSTNATASSICLQALAGLPAENVDTDTYLTPLVLRLVRELRDYMHSRIALPISTVERTIRATILVTSRSHLEIPYDIRMRMWTVCNSSELSAYKTLILGAMLHNCVGAEHHEEEGFHHARLDRFFRSPQVPIKDVSTFIHTELTTYLSRDGEVTSKLAVGKWKYLLLQRLPFSEETSLQEELLVRCLCCPSGPSTKRVLVGIGPRHLTYNILVLTEFTQGRVKLARSVITLLPNLTLAAIESGHSQRILELLATLFGRIDRLSTDQNSNTYPNNGFIKFPFGRKHVVVDVSVDPPKLLIRMLNQLTANRFWGYELSVDVRSWLLTVIGLKSILEKYGGHYHSDALLFGWFTVISMFQIVDTMYPIYPPHHDMELKQELSHFLHYRGIADPLSTLRAYVSAIISNNVPCLTQESWDMCGMATVKTLTAWRSGSGTGEATEKMIKELSKLFHHFTSLRLADSACPNMPIVFQNNTIASLISFVIERITLPLLDGTAYEDARLPWIHVLEAWNGVLHSAYFDFNYLYVEPITPYERNKMGEVPTWLAEAITQNSVKPFELLDSVISLSFVTADETYTNFLPTVRP